MLWLTAAAHGAGKVLLLPTDHSLAAHDCPPAAAAAAHWQKLALFAVRGKVTQPQAIPHARCCGDIACIMTRTTDGPGIAWHIITEHVDLSCGVITW